MPCPVVRHDARADLLDRRHQRIRQQHGPADVETELRPGLAIGADSGRIVIGSARDKAGSKHADDALEAPRDGRVVSSFRLHGHGVRAFREWETPNEVGPLGVRTQLSGIKLVPSPLGMNRLKDARLLRAQAAPTSPAVSARGIAMTRVLLRNVIRRSGYSPFAP
jgi:hypothetical protein